MSANPMKECPEQRCVFAPANGFLADASRETERVMTLYRAPMYLILNVVGAALTFATGHPLWWIPPVTCFLFGWTAWLPWWQLRCGKELHNHQKYWAVGGDLLCTVAIQFQIASFTPEFESFAMTNLLGFLVVLTATTGIRMDRPLTAGATILSSLALAVYLYFFPSTGRIYFFLLIWIAAWFSFMSTDIVRRAAERDALARFLPDQVADHIVRHPDAMNLGGESLLVTVMFTDLRGFTAIAAEKEPEEVMDLLNAVHEIQMEAIFSEGGTVNKIMGDGLLAIFGAPAAHPDPSGAALRSAFAIQKGIRGLEKKLNQAMRIGVGIHRGKVIAGNVGSTMQLEYTVVGDTVNIASRIEGMCKETDQEILMSFEAVQDLGGTVAVSSLGSFELRGHPHPLELFTATSERMRVEKLG